MPRTDWGIDCCNPVVVADFTKGNGPKLCIRHMGLDCFDIREPIEISDLGKRRSSKFARHRERR